MGQKVNPKSVRLVKSKDWQSRWYTHKKYRQFLIEDVKIKRLIRQKLPDTGIGTIIIERRQSEIIINIHTSRPGIIIGRGGQGVTNIKELIERELKIANLKINIIEIKQPELNALIVAQNLSSQITRRISYKRAMRQMLEKVMQAGALGIKIIIKGRLGGVEIARSEQMARGTLPVSVFRSDIDFAQVHAPTTYGIIGVKVWIHLKGIPEENDVNA